MSERNTSLEDGLKRMGPATLDAALSDRLESCANGDWTHLSVEETCWQNEVRNISPQPLNDVQLDRFSALFDGVLFQGNDRVAPFFAAAKQPVASSAGRRSWWGAAAAVGILGASAAWMIPTSRNQDAISGNQNTAIPAPASAAVGEEFVSAGMKRNFSYVNDQGVVWSKDRHPHRVKEVGYTERVRYTDAKGRVLEVQQPRVEIILVPANEN
ncbi:MAG: hypothetical protein V4733_08285 [Verrucomicrobiota bacterium]